MYFTEFLDSIKRVRTNWEPYEKWEKKQEDKDAQHKALANRVPVSQSELDKASSYGRTLIDAINTMDTYSINKAQDVELASKTVIATPINIVSALPLLAPMYLDKWKYYQNSKSKGKITVAAYGAALLAMLAIQAVGFSYTKYLDKQASRIARFQSREKELKDPRNFVIYNKDQLNAAKAISRNLPAPPPEKKESIIPLLNMNESVASIKSLLKDKGDYDNWKKEYLKHEQEKKKLLPKMNIPADELKEAKRDQRNILGAIRHIEIVSQNYLNHAEMAFKTFLYSDALLGLLAGGIASRGINLLQKFNYISKESKLANNAKSYAPMFGPAVLMLAAYPFVIPMFKEAAKIGRFKAKQELLKDPTNFIAYNDNQTNSVKNVKAKSEPEKGFFEKISDQFKFILQFKKDHNEFKKYNETQKIQEQKLDNALKRIKLNPGQLEEAKLLQKNTFLAFEKMDEKAQRYADDIEGATEIAQNFAGPVIGTVGALGALGVHNLLNKKLKPSDTKGKILQWTMTGITLGFSLIVSALMTSYATRIKQQSVKIGLMEAMEDLKDPKNFTNEAHQQKQTP